MLVGPSPSFRKPFSEAAVVLKSRCLRAGVTWGVLALFAAVMVCGEASHCLPGFGHFCNSSQSCCGHSCHDGHEPIFFGAVGPDHHQLDEGDCVICGFFALVHGLPIAMLDLGKPMSIVERLVTLRGLAGGDSICAYHSRAPPAA